MQAHLETGRYATPDEVVNRLIEERLSDEASQESPSAARAAELKASLGAAVSKPTRAYRKWEFVERAQRVIADDRGA